MGFHALLQGIFPTQGSNLGLLHCSRILYYVSHQGSPNIPNCCCLVTHRVQLFATPNTAACQVSLSFTISWSLLKLMSIESMMPSRCLVLCHPLFLLPSIFPSIRVFSDELTLGIRCPKYWASVSASLLPMNNKSWFYLVFTGLTSLQSKGLSRVFFNTTIWKCSGFFMVQLSYLYVTTGKNRSFDYKQNSRILILPRARHFCL